MKKIPLIILITFLLMLFPVKAGALEIKVEPAEAWIGNDVRISCWYTGNATLEEPWLFISKTPSSWNLTLHRSNSTYYWVDFTPPQNPPLLGTYQTYCSDGAVDSSQISFEINSLSSTITDYPEEVYLGKEIILSARVIEEGDYEQLISSNIDFQIYLNDINIPIDPQTYYTGDKWSIITEDLPWTINPGQYNLDLRATYKGNTVSNKKSVQVKAPVEFDFINVDEHEVQSEDNITITIKAIDEGNPILLENAQVKFTINSKTCEIVETSQWGNYLYFTISLPSLSADSYNLNTEIIYKDYKWNPSPISIDYVVPFTINIIDSDDEGVIAKFTFLKNGVKKKEFSTGSSGTYSDYIVPGEYDLDIKFPDSRLVLTEVNIDEFDDPIKFDNPSADIEIPGIGVGAIFVFEVALSYDDAYIEMEYDDSKILDENEISVYKCENWNFGRKVCNSDWFIVYPEVDKIRNIVEFNTSDLSAYVIGYKKGFRLDFDTDKDEYFLRDIIKIIGIIEDEDKKAVPDVKITASIPNTDSSGSTQSDNGGVFSLEIQAPNKEGDYEVKVKAEKSPFSSIESSKSIILVRSEHISLLIPDSIRVKQGENTSVSFEIVNIGQTDYSNLKLQLSGLPNEYYTLSKSEVSSLKAGASESVRINFMIPDDASKTSHTGNFKVTYGSNVIEQNFILTIISPEIEEENVTSSEDGFSFSDMIIPTGQMVLSAMTKDFILITIVGISSFSIAVFLKMRRSSPRIQKVVMQSQQKIEPEPSHEREDVKNLLLGIRMEIEKPVNMRKPSVKKPKKRKKKKKKRVRK